MMTAVVSVGGKITLGRDILQHIGISVGSPICIRKLPNGRIELGAAPVRSISDVFGLLKRAGQRPVSIEEMNEAIADGWAGIR